MKVCEKIKHLRQAQDLSQEEVAEKLGMTANGYGGIERGEVDIKLSRLKQLSELFGVELIELLKSDEQNIFNFKDTSTQNYCNIGSKIFEDVKLKCEVEKLQMEVAYLKETIELMKK
ncbi:MAG: helix-turn-helix transcriptional regulator [Methylobacter sp.]|nr:helix-turn-helix transcriptional regulator [Methylobacter sp.]MDP2427804.1 helix-turn-helix transcriptional regulator [Methylobacter sp.]MDP3053896.1 helix-turn-helix transcriptional regulator [Methylobacter sp.]MDP3360543.1 helix-turn-helix transcriptional regulator [Methylobacter sp.]MDZ4218222.1 helix-turn-helix transcriptional regulator [Methylobacter sp.]